MCYRPPVFPGSLPSLTHHCVGIRGKRPTSPQGRMHERRFFSPLPMSGTGFLYIAVSLNSFRVFFPMTLTIEPMSSMMVLLFGIFVLVFLERYVLLHDVSDSSAADFIFLFCIHLNTSFPIPNLGVFPVISEFAPKIVW